MVTLTGYNRENSGDTDNGDNIGGDSDEGTAVMTEMTALVTLMTSMT